MRTAVDRRRGLGTRLRTVRDGYLAPGEGSWLALGFFVVVGLLFGFFVLSAYTDADTWVPVMVIAVLATVSLPICGWIAGRPRDTRLYKILVIGMLLKILMAGPRYYLTEVYYDGEGDSGRYHQAGGYLVQNLAEGRWDIAPAELASFPKETRVVGYLVGVLYIPLGTSYFGGFLAFSWLSWIGLMFFFRSFQVAYPNAPPYFIAKLLLFFPSLIFWPSSLGKEAVMVFLLGLFTLGVSRILTNSKLWLGITYAGLAGYGMVQIRPHLLLVAASAMALSTLTKREGSPGLRGVLLRVLVLGMMVPFLVISVGKLDDVFGTGAEGRSLTQNLENTVDRTEIGGSAFETRPVRGPQDIPLALLTVLYRPFLFEATSITVGIAAAEGAALLALTVLSARWIWKVFPAMYRWPFAGYCGAYVLLFVVAFSNIGNAGILARQRVQMFPLLMLLVAAAREFYDLELASAEAEPDSHLDPIPTTAAPAAEPTRPEMIV